MRKFPKYKEPIQLNIGCGNDNKKGYINIDNRDLGYNMVWDIIEGIPFPDESVTNIYSSHFIEHLDDKESQDFIREGLRVLKKGGFLCIRCPHATTVGAILWGHKTFWNQDKIEALEKMDEPVGKFIIVENKEWEGQLLFTLKKI